MHGQVSTVIGERISSEHTRAIRHALAILIAVAIVLFFRPQDINLQSLTGSFDQRWWSTYTPYFPGFDALDTHEIFAPANVNRKKIVLLGASAVDSIGCDYTWHTPGADGFRNVHFSCSIAGKLNWLLGNAGLGEWKAFDLARNGAKLTDMLYTYARILDLKPEIVIYGDTFNYYMWENADADGISPARYAFMDEVFNRYPETAALWSAYKSNLQRHGWTILSSAPEPPIKLGPQPRASTTSRDLLLLGLGRFRGMAANGPSRPTAYDVATSPFLRVNKPVYKPHAFDDPDPDFGYFQGTALIAAMQRHMGNSFSFFFVPQWKFDTDIDYQNGLTEVFGGYAMAHGFPFHSFVSMKMQPIYETYDADHQTPRGNLKIARAILAGLQGDGLLPMNH
jgi:hypothetical protein